MKNVLAILMYSLAGRDGAEDLWSWQLISHVVCGGFSLPRTSLNPCNEHSKGIPIPVLHLKPKKRSGYFRPSYDLNLDIFLGVIIYKCHPWAMFQTQLEQRRQWILTKLDGINTGCMTSRRKIPNWRRYWSGYVWPRLVLLFWLFLSLYNWYFIFGPNIDGRLRYKIYWPHKLTLGKASQNTLSPEYTELY